MNTTAIVIIAVVVVVIAVGVFLYVRRRRSENLRKQFGPEYKRTIDQYGNQRKAEAALAAREERVRKLDIRGLTADEQNQFLNKIESALKRLDKFITCPSVFSYLHSFSFL